VSLASMIEDGQVRVLKKFIAIHPDWDGILFDAE
jgi:hypothetical protein